MNGAESVCVSVSAYFPWNVAFMLNDAISLRVVFLNETDHNILCEISKRKLSFLYVANSERLG